MGGGVGKHDTQQWDMIHNDTTNMLIHTSLKTSPHIHQPPTPIHPQQTHTILCSLPFPLILFPRLPCHLCKKVIFWFCCWLCGTWRKLPWKLPRGRGTTTTTAAAMMGTIPRCIPIPTSVPFALPSGTLSPWGFGNIGTSRGLGLPSLHKHHIRLRMWWITSVCVCVCWDASTTHHPTKKAIPTNTQM